MRVRWFIRNILFGVPMLSGHEYKKHHDLFMLQGITGASMAVLTGGVFLSGYALFLGANEFLTGILLALPLLMNVLQVFSAVLYERLESRKKFIMILLAIYRGLMCSIILIPLVVPQAFWIHMLIVSVIMAYSSLALLVPGFNIWIISLLPENIRGRYFSKREALFQTACMIISLVMGRVVDAMGRGYPAFAVVFATASILSIIDLIIISKVYEPATDKNSLYPITLKQLFRVPFSNREYTGLVSFWMLWNFSVWAANPYFAVYMINHLKLSYTFMSILNVIALISLIVAVRYWGRYGDEKSWSNGLRRSCLILMICFLLWVFVETSTLFLLPAIHILAGIGWAGINISSFNLLFKLCPQKGRTIFLGFNAAFSGLAGFFGPVLGGWASQALEDYSFALGIFEFNNMQMLFMASVIAQSIALIYGRNKMRSVGQITILCKTDINGKTDINA